MEAYLGFTLYLRDYILLYSCIAVPLKALCCAKVINNATWSKDCQEAFDMIKRVLSHPPTLSMPKDDLPFSMGTDASKYGIGAMLFQQEEKQCHYIAFSSCVLNKAQINYPTTKKELLAIVYALKKFQLWLYGCHFMVFSDHHALAYLLTQWQENVMISD